MAALDKAGIEGDRFRRRIEEQLDRVITRLGVNIDGPRENRRSGIILPPIICQPCVRLAHKNDFARSSMIQMVRRPLLAGKDFGDSLDALEHSCDAIDVRWMRDI